MARAERWIGSRQRWSGMRARPSQERQNRVVAARRRLASSSVGGDGQALGPRQRAPELLALAQDVPGPDPVGLDPQLHAGPQPHGLAGAAGVGHLPAPVHQRPVGQGAAVVEDGLADQLHLDLALQAAGRPHQQVVGVVVGRGPGVRRDLVLAHPRAHRQGVADLDPAGRRLPGRDQRVGPGLVDPRRRDVDAERPQPEGAGLPVEQRPEHARRVEPGHAQPVDGAVGGDQRAGVAVGEEGVLVDRGERRRHGRALEPLDAGDGGGAGLARLAWGSWGHPRSAPAAVLVHQAGRRRPGPRTPWRRGAPGVARRAAAGGCARSPRRCPGG